MKKMSLIVILLAMGSFLAAQDEPKQIVTGDLTSGLYFDQFASGNGYTDLFATILSLRGGGDVALRLNVTDFLSAGGSVGAYAISFGDGADAVSLFDIPLRVLVRLGYSGFNVEAHAGYIVSNAWPGMEYGAKATLAGFFLDYDLVTGAVDYTRIGVGLQIDKIFGF